MAPPIGVTGRRKLVGLDDTEDIRQRVQEAVTDTPLASAISGAYSFPHDWWLAIHWSLGMWGYYGDYMQSNCEEAADRLSTLLMTVRSGSPHTFQAVSAVVNYVLKDERTRCAALNTALRQIDPHKAIKSAANLGAAAADRVCGGQVISDTALGGVSAFSRS